MHRPTLRTRRRATVAATALIVLAVSSTAGARPDGGIGTRHVEITSSAPTLVGGDFGCDPTDPSRCAGTFRNVSTIAGDLIGTTYQVGTATVLPDGTYHGVAIVVFTGEVVGCGSGTLVMVQDGYVDPASGTNWGTATITAGEGTGDLTDVSGTLVNDSRVSSSSTGTIRCG